jgi:mannosyltransferase OCH1-like enzyme
MTIPKTFHVVWLGDKMPEREQQFLENNQKILNDYKFYLWNNDTYKDLVLDQHLLNFVNYAIENKKYAFASDVIKLVSLYKFGGWALDADNEIRKPLDEFLNYSWVSGFESYKGILNPITAAWGAVPEHKFTNQLLDFYKNNSFKSIISKPNTRWISRIMFDNGITNNNEKQRSESLGVDIFPDYVFCGPEKSNETYILHHFKGSWL